MLSSHFQVKFANFFRTDSTAPGPACVGVTGNLQYNVVRSQANTELMRALGSESPCLTLNLRIRDCISVIMVTLQISLPEKGDK